MSQTIGAFMALLTIMTFTANYQRSEILTQQRLVHGELEVMANAVASEVMNYVATRSFDAAVASGAVTRLDPNTSSLTPSSDFGGALYADASDIDDFHGVSNHEVTYQLANGNTFSFSADIRVEYVGEDGALSYSPTLTKEVTVTITGPYGMLTPVRMTRQFSPQWY